MVISISVHASTGLIYLGSYIDIILYLSVYPTYLHVVCALINIPKRDIDISIYCNTDGHSVMAKHPAYIIDILIIAIVLSIYVRWY